MSEKKEEKVEPPPINTKKWLYAFPVTKKHEKQVEELR